MPCFSLADLSHDNSLQILNNPRGLRDGLNSGGAHVFQQRYEVRSEMRVDRQGRSAQMDKG